MAISQKRTPKKSPGDGDWQSVFLRTLSRSGNVRASCKAAGVVRSVAYQVKDKDPKFAARWTSAMEEATDDLEAIARRRAKLTSDTLLIFLLKAHRPEKYRDNYRVELTGKDGEAIEIRRFIGVDIDAV